MFKYFHLNTILKSIFYEIIIDYQLSNPPWTYSYGLHGDLIIVNSHFGISNPKSPDSIKKKIIQIQNV